MTIGLNEDMDELTYLNGLNQTSGNITSKCKPSDYNCLSFDQYRFFGSTIRTMLTLFQIFTLDGWSSVVRPVVEQGMPMMLPVFILFIFLTTFGLLNLLIGVIVEHTTQMAKETTQENTLLDGHGQGQAMLGLIKLFMHADRQKLGEVEV